MKKTMVTVFIIISLSVMTIAGVFGLTACSGSASKKQTSTQNSNPKGTTGQKENAAASNDAKKEPTGEKVDVVIGSAQGTPESTVVIPVSLRGIPAKGIGSCNFSIKYDTGILEAVEVTPGETIGKNTVNFDFSINNSTGAVSFLFTSSTDGKDSISKDGVFANIKYKIKKDAKKGATQLTQGTAGAFGDVSLNRMNPVFTGGEVKVNE